MRKYLSTLPAFELQSTLTAGSDTLVITDFGNLVPAITLGTDTITLVVEPDTENEEIVTVIAHAAGSNEFTIVRAQEGTDDVTHVAGTFVKHMVTARDLQEPHQHINAKNYTQNGSKELHGLGSSDGDVVGTAKAQTLTNKTINLASGNGNNITNIPQTSVSNLVADLASKASTTHSHVVTDITGLTATVDELNILDGVTASKDELNHVDGVTSNIQTQLDSKAPLANPVFTTGISFEGSIVDGFDTTLTVTNPTANRTITLPNSSGTVALTTNMSVQGTSIDETEYFPTLSYGNEKSVYFTAPASGKVVIHHHAFFNVTSTSGAAASIYIKDSTGNTLVNFGADKERAYISAQKGFGNNGIGGTVYVGILTPGTNYHVYQQIKCTDATGAKVSKRELVVVPSL